MKLFGVFSSSFIVVLAIFASGCCLAADDVTGSESPPSSETTPVTEENSVETVTTSSSNQTLADVSDDPTPSDADPSQSPTTISSSSDEDGRNDTTHPSSLVPHQEQLTSVNQPVSQSEVVSDPTTILQETTTTTRSTTQMRLTTQPILTSTVTAEPIPVVDHSTAANLNDSATESTSSSTVSTTTTEIVTTKRPTRTPRTTTQRRTTTTTSPYHECVTSSTCLDPNAHCVNLGGTNTCECRTGFRKSSPNGSCVMIELPTTTTTSTTTTTTATTTSTPLENVTVTSSTVQSSSTEPPTSPVKRVIVRQASDLSKEEKMDVVSIALQPATSVVEWLLEQDLSFRTAIATILTSSNFSIVEETESTKTVNVTADQVLYVAPSPQLTAEGLLISFLVQDKDKVKPRHHSFLSGIIARHKREVNPTNDTLTGYLPSVWITTAIRNSQHHLEAALNQTVSSLFGGIIPYQLLSLEQLAAASLFERRLDIFIPLILVAALGFMGLAVSLVCIRAKTRSMATWDPPAGVVFGKTSINKENREDPLGCTSKPDSTGQHLATDEQCRDGEEQLMKNSSGINADDDVWVVPYEDGPPQGQPGQLKTQYEDTKL